MRLFSLLYPFAGDVSARRIFPKLSGMLGCAAAIGLDTDQGRRPDDD
jgi:hypothetical protein